MVRFKETPETLFIADFIAVRAKAFAHKSSAAIEGVKFKSIEMQTKQ